MALHWFAWLFNHHRPQKKLGARSTSTSTLQLQLQLKAERPLIERRIKKPGNAGLFYLKSLSQNLSLNNIFLHCN